MTPVLRDLHWPPIQQRVGLKHNELSLTSQAVHGTASRYLCELLTLYQPGRSLQPGDAMLLTDPPILPVP